MPLFAFADPPSDSPFVDRVWRCHSHRAGTFTSVAASHCELVVTRHRGRIRLTVRGPETRPTPADAEWIGIRLSIGTWLPLFPAETVRDRRDADLRGAGRRAFRLDNSAWEYPTFDNTEAVVARLARTGVLVRDPAVSAALAGDWHAMTRRSAQRHFRLATGLTHRAYRQVERARYAAGLLPGGAGIGETVHLAGYYDQAHLTRSLKRLIGSDPRAHSASRTATVASVQDQPSGLTLSRPLFHHGPDLMNPSDQITAYIDKPGDSPGKTVARIRAVIRAASPDLVEEWEWSTPVWSSQGNVLAVGLPGPREAQLPPTRGVQRRPRRQGHPHHRSP